MKTKITQSGSAVLPIAELLEAVHAERAWQKQIAEHAAAELECDAPALAGRIEPEIALSARTGLAEINMIYRLVRWYARRSWPDELAEHLAKTRRGGVA